MNHLFEAIYLTDSVILLFLGLIILRENPHLRINRITSILLFFGALGSILGACDVSVDDEFAQLFIVRISAFWQFFFPQLLIFAIYYPSRIVSAEQRRVPYLLFIPHLFQFLLLILFHAPEQILLLSTYFETHFLSGFLQPLALICQIILGLLAYLYEIHRTLFAFVNLTYTILALIIIYRGYRQLAGNKIKNQVRVIWSGLGLSLGMLALAGLLPNLLLIEMSEMLSHAITVTGVTLGAAAISWAMIKYQFLDIRFFIRKSIIFSMVSSVLIGCYLFVYIYTKQFFNQLVGLDIPILEILFLIFAAVFFQPLLAKIENFVNKYFFKETPDFQETLQELSQDILRILDIDELRQKLTHTLTTAMSLERIYLLLNDGANNFSAPNPIASGRPFTFENGSEFIQLMNQFEQPVLMEKIETRLQSSREKQQLREMQVELFVPLSHRRTLEGILFLGQKLDEINFSSEDMMLLNILSTQIAIALENAQLYQEMVEKQRIDEEIGLAREIQRMLLPQQFPTSDNYDISAINIPSKEVGGDYYDFIEVSEHQTGIAIGDISGKGIPGSLLMSNLQATFRAVANLSTEPSKVMRLVNMQIARTTTPEKYATFFYAIFDASRNTLTYTNAGHNFPVIVRENGQSLTLKESDLIVGIDENAVYHQHQVKLLPGDLLICYTDGITEAMNAENVEFGEERFLNIITSQNWNSTREIRNQIYETVSAFAAGMHQYDDMTLVILQIQ